jgi:F-type H+-transporting ATPase subunit epsilon
MQVEIVTPEAVLYSGDADMLIARGQAGEVGILKDHEPMLVGLDYGEMRIYVGDELAERFAVYGGFLEVRDNVVSVLSDDAEIGSKIDLTEAEREHNHMVADDKLNRDDPFVAERLRRAEVRLAVAEHAAGKP